MAEVKSVNDQIHEDLISHDIDLRRIDADCRLRAEKRLDRLGSDLADLTRRIDPVSATRNDTRKRRLAKLERQARELIREAYADIAKENAKDLKRVARAESEKTIDTIAENLP